MIGAHILQKLPFFHVKYVWIIRILKIEHIAFKRLLLFDEEKKTLFWMLWTNLVLVSRDLSSALFYNLKYTRNKLIWKIIKPKQWHKSASMHSEWARKLKKVQAKKKLVKSNKSISRKNFFLIFSIIFFSANRKFPQKNLWNWLNFILRVFWTGRF